MGDIGQMLSPVFRSERPNGLSANLEGHAQNLLHGTVPFCTFFDWNIFLRLLMFAG